MRVLLYDRGKNWFQQTGLPQHSVFIGGIRFLSSSTSGKKLQKKIAEVNQERKNNEILSISSADQASSLDGNLKKARSQRDEEDASPPVMPAEDSIAPDPKWEINADAMQDINKAVLSDAIPLPADQEKLVEQGVKTAPKPKKRNK